jgi:hydrogenase maturation protease
VARHVCLMGVGNVLLGDDALGPYVLEWLRARWEFPAEVTLLDAGTPGLDLTLFLDGFDALIVADAVKGPGPAGEVRSWRRPALLAAPLPIVMSPHEPTLREALLRLELLGRGPKDVLLVGAVPARVSAGTGLSEAVSRAVPEIEQVILRELERLGATFAPRAKNSWAVPWWEGPAVRP